MSVVGIIIAIFVFSALILIHESGHFLAAKKSGVLVKEFSLGLGPTIVGFGKGETKYSLKALPFGGACIMEGEDGVSCSDRAFNNQSVWKRILIVISGPLFNLLTALIFSIIIVSWFGSGESYIYDVIDGGAAREAGLESGDRILKLNNKNIRLFKEIGVYLDMHPGQDVRVVYERDGERKSTVITPRLEEDGYYYLGVTGGLLEHKGFFKTLKCSWYEMRFWVCLTYEGIYQLILGKVGVKGLSGPVGIVSAIDQTYQSSRPDGIKYVVANLINIIILLSANLGIMNLIPLPALDGGRLVFLLIEALTGYRVPEELEGRIHFVGLMLLFLLMIVIMFNDIRALL